MFGRATKRELLWEAGTVLPLESTKGVLFQTDEPGRQEKYLLFIHDFVWVRLYELIMSNMFVHPFFLNTGRILLCFHCAGSSQQQIPHSMVQSAPKTFKRIDWFKMIDVSYPVSYHNKFPLWKFVPYLKIVIVVWSWTQVFFKNI